MFKPGESGNPAGRPKGTKNQFTLELKNAFKLVLTNKMPELERYIDRVAEEDPAKAADLIIKLTERFLPRIAQTQVTNENGENLFKDIQFNFGKPLHKDDQQEGEIDIDK